MSSIVKVDTIQENTSANGITVDGLNIKDSKLVTADSVVTSNITNDAVTIDKLNLISTGSAPSLEAKGDGSSQDGYIQLNCSQNSHGIKLKSPAHSAGASYTLTFPPNDGDADQFLKTDGSGGLSFASAGGTNTPNFLATMSASQNPSNATATLVNFNQTTYDSASGFDTSNKKYVIPSAGYYHIYANVNMYNTSNDLDRIICYINIGGSTKFQTDIQIPNAPSAFCYVAGVWNCSANDAVEVKIYQVMGSGTTTIPTDKNYFGGYKIIT